MHMSTWMVMEGWGEALVLKLLLSLQLTWKWMAFVEENYGLQRGHSPLPC